MVIVARTCLHAVIPPCPYITTRFCALPPTFPLCAFSFSLSRSSTDAVALRHTNDFFYHNYGMKEGSPYNPGTFAKLARSWCKKPWDQVQVGILFTLTRHCPNPRGLSVSLAASRSLAVCRTACLSHSRSPSLPLSHSPSRSLARSRGVCLLSLSLSLPLRRSSSLFLPLSLCPSLSASPLFLPPSLPLCLSPSLSRASFSVSRRAIQTSTTLRSSSSTGSAASPPGWRRTLLLASDWMAPTAPASRSSSRSRCVGK
jgi:hypothetical protein